MKHKLVRTSIAAGLSLLALLVLRSVAQDAAPQHNFIPEYERRAGWRLLFDGKTTDGWRNFKRDTVSDGWVVEDGALIRRGKDAGDLVTRETFQSFDLSFEYKISKGGNSGVMFHVTEEADAPWQTGPEIQIQDNVEGKDPQKSGWLYQLYPADKDTTRPAGEWNKVHLLVTSRACEIRVNDVLYSRFVKGGEDWNQRVAASKFAEFPLFGKANEGHICLQDHGDEVAFRNIRIRPLHDEFWPGK